VITLSRLFRVYANNFRHVKRCLWKGHAHP
jgi:hypothetical protein